LPVGYRTGTYCASSNNGWRLQSKRTTDTATGGGQRPAGTPGAAFPKVHPFSPLLSNLYMRRFILGWKQWGCERRWSAHIVNYADDLVICCKYRADEAMNGMRSIMEKLRLTVNDDKTHLCRIPQERFDFLGYTFGRCYSRVTGRAYIGTRPSKKSIKRMVDSITEETDRRRTLLDAEYVVGRLNRKLTGWANYFCLGPVSPAYQAINTHVIQRLRRWLCRKHKVQGSGRTRYPDQYLYEVLGLINLPRRTHDLPWAKA
jgi:RNA-directed DNA polymerase